ncbi:vera protein [Hypoxylon sp. NC1633]|nr:vera protein [Hypoxylon sp. NC1633]
MDFSITPILLSWGLVGALITVTIRFVHQGYVHRSRIRSLRSQGIPIAPHSLIIGHISIFADFRRSHPPDININVFHIWLARSYQKYFPGLERLPPVVYLDLWPVGPQFALVYDAAAVSQFTQTKSLPKLHLLTQYIKPLTSGLDIVSTEGALWKTWRSRFNPGFGSRNISALLPELIEDVSVFTSQLRDLSGNGGEWGPVFQLREKSADLTFDVICQVTLGMSSSKEPSQANSSFKSALRDQVRLMNLSSNGGLLRSKLLWHRAKISKNNRIMRNVIMPFIESKLYTSQSEKGTKGTAKTAIDLAIQHAHSEDTQRSTKLDPDFADMVISNIKAFIFAGEDTTATTICFLFKRLQDNPNSLSKLRDEHDRVLGPAPEHAAAVLSANPHLLHNLPYTLAVIKETLRLHPLASTARQAPPGFVLNMPRSGTATTQFPLGGFAPWVAAAGLQQSTEYWPRATEFLPERWMEAEGEPLYPRKDAWVPFSIGPRNCIGMELALAQLKLVCVLVVRSFEVEEAWDEWDEKLGEKATPAQKVDGQRLYEVSTGPVQPKDGMPVHVRLRV